jgi:hypothetical protein
VDTTDGPERLVVDRRSVKNESLEVGYPIVRADDRLLVERPRETSTGSWRVWVPEDKVIAQGEEART